MPATTYPANWSTMTPAQQQAWLAANPGASGQSVTEYMAQNVVDPQVPNAAQLTPVLQNTDEAFLNSSGQMLEANAANTIQNPAPQVAADQVTAAQTDPNAATSQINPTSGTYQASLVGGNAAQGTTEAMQVNNLSTVQGQLNQLYAGMVDGQIPQWAQAAVNTVGEYLSARGLKASGTISATAMYGAVQAQALNIAAADAATYFQADLASYSAKQQMNMENLKNRQQSLLSDQSAQNAAKQFNASSEAQTQQFMASLVASINEQNAARVQASNLANQNANLAASQFNSQQEFQRSQFNAQQQFAIDQSNVLWRRQLNTANTAAVNAANQFNVQNKFNLSVTAMNNLWQQLRDEASWAFTASENDKNRNYNLAIMSNNQSFIEDISDTKWYEELGGLAASIFFT